MSNAPKPDTIRRLRKVTTFGNMLNGKLSVIKRDQFLNALLNVKNGICSLTVEIIGEKRTGKQNGYYHAVVVTIIRDAINEAYGEDLDDEETHELLKLRFNSKLVWNPETGEYDKMPMSTSRLNTAQFGEYVEKCRRMAKRDFDIDIPDADKLWRENQQLQLK
ncbi:hypothetical protein [Spirosoma sp.]|uniref:hypothetical protein n=1 Tax=Spirosoma sp. TaxID=1899569 RepID=UPI002636AC6C|nr:hypothetical protein [Spirosoma sp.]MCX6217662.1 hypothetical protein [Spirosoma sp.]